ncbi:transcription factor [Ganoderma sinense ZZ0214-1]|uniref:Transcription factor n=1 Tax=Ganoderma sinense ZZ0214-1 TaxID=1077348 RepID=A0A2G8SM15_9APHY|nr:transcription factor [Ganoderma sinense ZZ0214-1]
MSTPKASKKLPGAWTSDEVATPGADARTSDEAAAPAANSPVPFLEPLEFEGTGTSPSSFHLPAAEPGVLPVHPRLSLAPVTDDDLSLKWGIPDFEELAEAAENRRMTRRVAKLARSGESSSKPAGLVYRGHRGLREKTMRKTKQMDAETCPSDSEPVAPSAPGAPVVEASQSNGEPAAPSAGAPVEGTSHPGGEPAVHNAGAPIEEGATPDAETAAHAASSRSEEDEIEELLGSSQGESDRAPDDGWKVTKAGSSPVLSTQRDLAIAAQYFPSWFDLCEDEDQYGPIPVDWLFSPSGTPVLPDIKVDPSLLRDFWQDVESSDEERDVQRAIEASIVTAVAERERREQAGGLGLHAVIVEVPSDEDEEPEGPAGPDGRYTTEQKGKGVRRTKDQRDFLREFVTGRHSKSEKDKPKSKPTKGKTPAPQGPTHFKREPSQVPEGGWFHASTAAGGRIPPSPPSSSSSSSSSDSDSSDGSSESGYDSSDSSSSSSDDGRGHRGKTPSEKRHREKQKRETKRIRKALAGVKIKPPFSWNGSPDLDLFDQWTYEVDTWRELYGLSDKLAIKLVVQFLTGTAGKFFMKHVATCQSEWTIASLYEALFDYCFPTDYKAQLHLRLEHSVQGKSKVRDFVREIQHLAARFPDVSDFQLAQIFWRGIHGHIRVYLIEKGLHPERTALDKMVKYAARREEAYVEARRDERAFEGQVPGRTWGRFANRTTGPEPYQPNREQRDKRGQRSEQRDRREQRSEQRDSRDQGNRNGQGRQPSGSGQHRRGDHKKGAQSEKLTKEQRDKLRAEGRCFTCGEKGHESRNCTTRKTARAPNVGVNASSVRFANIERLAENARQANGGVRLASIRVATPGDSQVGATSSATGDGIWVRAHTSDCIEYLLTLLVSYFDPEEACAANMEPEDRFTVRTYNYELYDSEFLIIDHLAPPESPDEFVVSRTQMDDPEWGIPDMLQEAWEDYSALPARASPNLEGAPQDRDIWARAHVSDCIEYLRTMLITYFEPEEARTVGMEPEERFCIQTNSEELHDHEFLVYDRLAPVESPAEFVVSRAQLDEPEWSIDDMLQEAWNEYVSLPPRAEWGQGFPSRGVPDKRYPARFWLKAKLMAALQQGYPYLSDLGYSVSVKPHAEGYGMFMTDIEEPLFIGHEEVCSAAFDAQSVLTAVVEDAGLDVLESRMAREARRRQRRMTLMVCAARTGVKPRKGKKPEQPANWIPAVERNAMKTKDFTRVLPKPIVVTVQVNGQPVRALIDTGSMADFLSTTIVDQLGLKKEVLAKPLPVQLAVHGSRSKINCCVTVDFQYQEINCKRRFDVVNLDNYDMILGTPFLFQHKVAIGLNPIRISVGSDKPLDIQGEEIAVITSAAADLLEDELD